MYDPIWSVLLVEGDYKAVIVGRESGALEKYRLNDLKGKPILSLKTAHKGTVTTLAIAPAGGDEIYSASLDKSICHWNLTDDLEQLEAEAGGKRLIKATLTTTGIRCGVVVNELLCCGGSDGCVHALRDGAPERWVGHTDVISCVSQTQTDNGDALLASGSYDGRILVWNVASGSSLYSLAGHTSQIKGVQFINNGSLGVMGLGRDDKMRLWLLPEALELDGNNGEADVAEEGDEDDGEGSGGHHHNHHHGSGPKKLDCSAVIGLPAPPLCVTSQPETENPIIAIGLSGGAMATVKANKFLTSVSTFTKLNASEVKKERKRLEALLKAEERKELLLRKKALRKKKKELIEEQQTEESDKKKKGREERQAARAAARGAPREDDDDEEREEEEEPEEPEEEDEYAEDEEDGEDVGLTEERQETLNTFKNEQKKESDERLKALRTSVSDRKAVLEPIGVKKFERTSEQFDSLTFSRYLPRAASESINAVALNGAKAIVACGNVLTVVDSTPGVQAI